MKENWDRHWRDWPIEKVAKNDEEIVVDLLFRTKTVREWWDGKRVLDAGCGMGRYTRALTKMGATVVACDVGPKSVKYAVENAYVVTDEIAGGGQAPSVHVFRKDRQVRGLVVDLSMLSEVTNETFDAVICLNVLAHMPKKKEPKAVRELIKALKPGGVLVLWMYRNENWWRNAALRSVRCVTRWLPFEVTKGIGVVLVPVTRLFARGKPYGRVPLPQNIGEWTAWFACRDRREYDEQQLYGALYRLGLREIEMYGWLNKGGGGGIGMKGVKV